MREVLEGLRRVLLAQPKIWTENVMVRFSGFGASSLDIEVMAWFVTTDWNEFLAIREQVLLEFMGVVEQAKTGFAFPTRTIHIASNAANVEDGLETWLRDLAIRKFSERARTDSESATVFYFRAPLSGLQARHGRCSCCSVWNKSEVPRAAPHGALSVRGSRPSHAWWLVVVKGTRMCAGSVLGACHRGRSVTRA